MPRAERGVWVPPVTFPFLFYEIYLVSVLLFYPFEMRLCDYRKLSRPIYITSPMNVLIHRGSAAQRLSNNVKNEHIFVTIRISKESMCP